MIHYHGCPITPETCAFRVLRGRHAFVSFPNPGQIELVASVCQSFALDNGAFVFWRRGEKVEDWSPCYDWVGKWLRHPACDWAVIPDVIEGTEDENDALIAEWPHGLRGVPVWHLNESIDRLCRLADAWPRVALGSCDEWDVKRPRRALARLAEVLPAISDDGTPRVKLHGLRMLNPAITSQVPLSSGDSQNISRNLIDQPWRGPYEPATKETRAQILAERIENVDTPAVMSNVWRDNRISLWDQEDIA